MTDKTFEKVKKFVSKDAFTWIIKDSLSINEISTVLSRCGINYRGRRIQTLPPEVLAKDITGEVYKNPKAQQLVKLYLDQANINEIDEISQKSKSELLLEITTKKGKMLETGKVGKYLWAIITDERDEMTMLIPIFIGKVISTVKHFTQILKDLEQSTRLKSDKTSQFKPITRPTDIVRERLEKEVVKMSVHKCLAIILGGGRGTRLYPLTKERCKPAIGFAGKYRIIDIPLTNCIHSGIKNILVLTQFLTESLHRHIFQTYRFDIFSEGIVRVISAEQTHKHDEWFQGTADAVRQCIRHFKDIPVENIIVLSGDHLYKMDYSHFLHFHTRNNADVTLASMPVPVSEIKRMGVVKEKEDGEVVGMVEKPESPDLVKGFDLSSKKKKSIGFDEDKTYFFASMGVYMFKKNVLIEILEKNKEEDFGKQIIPWLITRYKCFSYPFNGFWEDIGTIKTYYNENLNLVQKNPKFKLFDENWPLFTHPRFLPASKIAESQIKNSLIADGCIIENCTIDNSVIGIRSVIKKGSYIKNTIIIGNDQYHMKTAEGTKNPHIGQNVKIDRAIIDKNVTIGNNCKITSKKDKPDSDNELYYIRDGIVVIPRGAVIPAKTVI